MMLTASTAWAELTFTSDGINYTVKEGTNECAVTPLTPGTLYEKSVLNIPQQVKWEDKTYIVTEIGDGAFRWHSELTAVTLPKTLKRIGEFSFQMCPGLTAIGIPDNVETIGKAAFSSCTKLKEVVLPPKLTEIDFHMFYACTELLYVYIGPNVTTIKKEVFQFCEHLRYIYTQATTPPTIEDESVFQGVDGNPNVVVKDGCEDAYRSAYGWKKFSYGIKGGCRDMLKTPELMWVKGHPQFVTDDPKTTTFLLKAVAEPDFSKPFEVGEEVVLPVVVTYRALGFNSVSNNVVRTLYLTAQDLFGDMNKDGKVDKSDVKILSDKILNEEFDK